MKDVTQAMLSQFSREWAAGDDAKLSVKRFAKHYGITQRQALWCIVHFTTAQMDERYPEGRMDGYMDAWIDAMGKR